MKPIKSGRPRPYMGCTAKEYVSMPAFAWTDRGKPRNSSVRICGIPVEIRTKIQVQSVTTAPPPVGDCVNYKLEKARKETVVAYLSNYLRI
jgi:hypothetical protein